MRRRLLVPFLALAVAASAYVSIVDSSVAAAVGSSVLKRWGATMGGSQELTETQAIANAEAVDVLVGHPRTHARYTAQMRAANPSLKLVFYMNGMYDNDAKVEYPESWYLRDAAGNRVWSSVWSNLLMNPTDPGWIQSRIDDCGDTVATHGWDGCYLDMLGSATLVPGYVSAAPINPATGAEWTTPDWIDATASLASTVTSALPERFVVGNGIGTGTQYFTPAWGPTSKLLDAGIVAGNAQGFVRGDDDLPTEFRPEAKWKADVDMLVDAGLRSKSIMTMTKMWLASATQAEKDAVHRYALSTFLLGTDGNQYWYWSDAGAETAVVQDTPYEHVDVGNPIGTYAKMGGVYQRRFTGGLVAVNPTPAPVTIPLGPGQWTTLDGMVVQGELTLAGNTGEALRASQPWGSVPTSITGQATSVTPTSAVIPATVHPGGLATTATVAYGPDSTVPLRSAPVAVGSGTTRTTTRITLTGLTPGTSYTYHVEATNSAGTTAGIDEMFTTPLPPPVARTTGASILGPMSVVVTGAVNPNGLATSYRFDYGLTTSYSSSTESRSAGSGTTTDDVEAPLFGLPIGALLHYRVQATNSTGTTYGPDRTIQLPKPPGAVTKVATAGTRSATLAGTVNPNGSRTDYFFEWGTTTSYGQRTAIVDAGSGAGGKNVTAAISGLTPRVIYNYRIVATNASGTAAGINRTVKSR